MYIYLPTIIAIYEDYLTIIQEKAPSTTTIYTHVYDEVIRSNPLN